ncbi:Exonuclease RNase T and DNA polymerase III [Xylanimonas cellulosilytica DSM 15894]|uniref:Exonuclease RNase T and DNA polymerase III n=1 Tax=Xylanimonas cellulosilytica (strain DSM 15894 / JCM 12276 / CECT 5975 / KCTC 9989 / LMG 20990 / NBRC 107835 / XIL07) TaxID=446471 RepID=D1BXB7_XYLCX|nr:exonuclease domain-containing protein [Xylanimonas cellulosilytica]ACZ29727.1 Exonuclease RNase T and DNA polymerase III [Xylanimonas cellulosilytica DSM 15894]
MSEQQYDAFTAGWARGPLVGFDTETTGVDVANDRIVTAAVVLRIPGVSTDVRTWLVDPGVEIPAEAAAIHGVTTEHARAHGVAPAVALEEIAAELAAHLREGVPVVAYNAAFDLSLLDAELARHGLATLPERLGRAVTPVLDPLVLDRWQDRYRRGKRRLGDLVTHYGVLTTEDLHAADVDVLATLDVLDALVRTFPELGALGLEELHHAQVGAHDTWARSFNEWRARQGLDGPGASRAWPVEHARR